MNAWKSYAKISDIKVQELCTMTVDEYIKKVPEKNYQKKNKSLVNKVTCKLVKS